MMDDDDDGDDVDADNDDDNDHLLFDWPAAGFYFP